jgi:GT2 family glycosyltransferase
MEEIDLCWRMQLAGYKVTVVPESVVYHVGGGTLPATSPFKLYLNFRNNLLMLENNLAKTYGLSFMRAGMNPSKASGKAVRKARRRICFRKCLDMMSAAVYLLTLKTDCCKSVLKAHRDAAKMIARPSAEDVRQYLERGRGEVKGIYRKWIILFRNVKEKDFYNI